MKDLIALVRNKIKLVKRVCLPVLNASSYKTSADSDVHDKTIEYSFQTEQRFCMCCNDYACKSAQHNLFLFFVLCAGHSFVHDRKELSSSMLRLIDLSPRSLA